MQEINITKKAFIFPGQGAQNVGMGKGIFEAEDWARGMWAEANDILGFDLSNIVLNGPEEELKKTNEELSAFNRLAVGRELRMIELKSEINELLKKLGQEEKYKIIE